ncbi:MAG: hypothetical protein PHT51_00055 [Patescibacteria group bacterium]|nr:hypothetical protein [Patescibacteria group bacterium]MDD4610627.1 hypothetical protein [Patescibacteria group bacterium]
MAEKLTPQQIDQVQEEAWSINDELDGVLAGGRYTKKQETADLIIKKRELAESFKNEWDRAIKSLPEGEKPTMPLNEKAIANMYMAGHMFGKDFTMEHIAQCLVRGKDVTDKIKFPQKGSRYFQLNIPEGAGMPGRFVVPNESGTALAEHVANWNQECEFKFRHGELSPIIKKKDLPQWLIDLESVFYVIIEKNEILDQDGERFKTPKLQVADGPTEDDPEGSWLISTVHYGQPSRRKPRPPKMPNWKELKNDPILLMEAMINFQKDNSEYLKACDSYGDEQKRVVFVDLEEEGVGQKGIKKKKPITDETVAELVNDNAVLRKLLDEALGKINALGGEIKGLTTRVNKKNS